MELTANVEKTPIKFVSDNPIPKEIFEDAKKRFTDRVERQKVQQSIEWVKKWNKFHEKVKKKEIDAVEYWKETAELLEEKKQLFREFPFSTYQIISGEKFTDNFDRPYTITVHIGERIHEEPMLTFVQAWKELGLHSQLFEGIMARMDADLMNQGMSPEGDLKTSAQEYAEHLKTLDNTQDVETVKIMINEMKAAAEKTMANEDETKADKFVTAEAKRVRRRLLENLDETFEEYSYYAGEPIMEDVIWTAQKKGDAVMYAMVSKVPEGKEEKDLTLLRHLQNLAEMASDHWKYSP